MLGLSNGLTYPNATGRTQVYTYASNWWQFDSAGQLADQGWLFNPCNSNYIYLGPTGGTRNNDNYIMVVYLAGNEGTSCMTWQGTLLSASELGGGLKDGDVVNFSYEMFLASGNDKWSPGDGSDVAVLTSISGFTPVSTNFTPQTTPGASYTAVNIEVTKSGGAQDEGLNINIGPFTSALTNAAVLFRRVNATVTRPE